MRRGFTLVELLVVVGIISLLSSMALSTLGAARAKARDARRLIDMHNIQTALELYKSKYGGYPRNSGVAYIDSAACGGFDAGYDGPSDDDFIHELVSEFFSKTPGDPLGDGGCSGGYIYKYKWHNALTYGCPRPFYVLGVKDLETIPDTSPATKHPGSRGFECASIPASVGDAFEWIVSKDE